MSGLTPEQIQDWVIDTNYPCMGREIRPDSLVGIMDTGGDLVMALPLEEAEIVIERIQSLRAQLAAREQEAEKREHQMTVVIRNAASAMEREQATYERAMAAEAEVDRLRKEATRAHEVTCCPSHATSHCICVQEVQEILGKALGLEFLTKEEWPVPPQTTETRG